MKQTCSMTWLVMLAVSFGFVSAAQAQSIDFATQVLPIFEASCFKCHGPEKPKGEFRLDRRDMVLDEAIPEEDRNIIRGNAEESELYILITLDADDPDVMPGKGDPLTDEQKAIFKQWIDEGANWPDEYAVIEVKLDQPQSDFIETIELPELTEKQKAAEAKAIEAITARNILATRIAANTMALDVNFALQREAIKDADLQLLKGTEPTLLWLDLGRTGITDAGLETLKPFKQITRLHLEHTQVTDAGLQHIAALENLTYLNCFGTSITDAGLQHLQGLTKLRKLYLWQSGVTDEGIAALQAAVPELSIDVGGYMAVTVEEPEQTEDADEDEGEDDEEDDDDDDDDEEQVATEPVAAGTPINTKCPLSGEAVDARQVFVFKNQTIGFCCDMCLAKFKANPEQFVAKVAEFKPIN